MQHLEALEVVIHATKGVQDDDVDPLQNSIRLNDTSRLPRGGGPIKIDPSWTSGDPPIRPNFRPFLQQFLIPSYDKDLGAPI